VEVQDIVNIVVMPESDLVLVFSEPEWTAVVIVLWSGPSAQIVDQ